MASTLSSPVGSALEAAHVAVLYGGRSSERDVSLITGRDVVAALSSADDGRGPRRVTAVEVDTAGAWIVSGRPLAPHEALRELAPLDVVFLGLHGGEGEDGTLQAWLELSRVAYTGSGPQASALCMDKLALRGVALQKGLRVAPGACVSAEEWRNSADGALAGVLALDAPFGWFVKPRCGGSSVATTALGPAATRAEWARALDAVFATGDDALVEARIAGVEVSCGVLADSEGAERVFSPIEICPRAASFFDYAEKYSAQGAEEVCPPRSLAPTAIERVQAAALAAHRAARCAGYSRTDFIVPGSSVRAGDASSVAHEPVLLEVNTLPGLTPRSLLPQEAAVAGIDYRSLCLAITSEALVRRGRRG
ncbi:MAG: D-alanine--D-alanine ligase [Planctomycetes bacterium]|nr:D-alanine--D-alanine ligase [Planctomycetota bacterium]